MSNRAGLAIFVGVSVVGTIVLVAAIGKRNNKNTGSFNPWSYDFNGDGMIGPDEALQAIDDNLAGRITTDQLNKVLTLTGDKELLAAIGVQETTPEKKAPVTAPVKLVEAPKTESFAATYDNVEEIELLDIDKDLLMPRKIIIHRKARVTK